MALTFQEKALIQQGQQDGKTQQEILQALVNYRKDQLRQGMPLGVQTPKRGSFGETFDDVKQTGTSIRDKFRRGADKVAATKAAFKSGEQGLLESAGQLFGAGATAASQSFGDLIVGSLKVALPPDKEEALKKTAEEKITEILGISAVGWTVDQYATAYNESSPRQQRNIDASLGTIMLGLDVAGVSQAAKAVTLTRNALRKSLANARKSSPAASGFGVGGGGGGGLPPPAGAGQLATLPPTISKYPARITTNLAEGAAQREKIAALATDTARRAAVNGVELNDINYIYKTAPKNKAAYTELLEKAKLFDDTRQAVDNPANVIGNQVRTRTTNLQGVVDDLGRQLGEVADGLGDVARVDAEAAVLARLRRVGGMDGLKVADDGTLNFEGTILGASINKSVAESVSKIFAEAVADGSGKSKHLLRQALFEDLGGKRGVTALTSTEENAVEAIRKGLADVLDATSDEYKLLNFDYATARNPVDELKKLLKASATDVADEDLFDQAASILARRLTATNMSSSRVQKVFNNLDNQLAKHGQAPVGNLYEMQEFYNVLDIYYDIANRTGFRGLTGTSAKGALSKGGIADAAFNFLKQTSGVTPAVRKESLERVIREALGTDPSDVIPTSLIDDTADVAGDVVNKKISTKDNLKSLLDDERGAVAIPSGDMIGGVGKETRKALLDDINAGGITQDLVSNKSLAGQDLYAVSVYPERSVIKKGIGTVTPDDLEKFLVDNEMLLRKKGHTLGGWIDDEAGETVLDVTVVTPNRATAETWGRRFNQKAITDLSKVPDDFDNAFIPTGGTGKVEDIGRLPSIEKRIKHVARGFDDLKYQKNLRIDGDKVMSYDTHVATIKGDELIEHGKFSQATSKHVNHVADRFGLKKVSDVKKKE
jgi:hypothetical protein